MERPTHSWYTYYCGAILPGTMKAEPEKNISVIPRDRRDATHPFVLADASLWLVGCLPDPDGWP